MATCVEVIEMEVRDAVLEDTPVAREVMRRSRACTNAVVADALVKISQPIDPNIPVALDLEEVLEFRPEAPGYNSESDYRSDELRKGPYILVGKPCPTNA
jgi:hypothetical protein